MVIGAPTAPRRRIVRCRRIVRVSWCRWVVAVVAVWVWVIVIGVREHGAQGESAEPDPDGGTRADPTSTPTTTCICRPRQCRQPDGGKDRRRDGQSPTSLPKEPVNGHIPLLSWAQACKINSGSEAAVA